MTSQHPPIPDDLLHAIRDAKRIALIGHVTPDADCLTSIGGMHMVLRSRGQAALAVLPEGTVARKLHFLVELADMAPASNEELARADLALVVDTAKADRVNIIGKLDALPGVPVANVDHHASNPRFGKWNWVDGARSSSAEMVYELVRALRVELAPALATLLYAGIHSDTQGFSLSNTTPRSLDVAHDLAAAGAQVADICEKLHRSHSRSEFELLQVVYRNTRLGAGGRLAWSTATHDEIVGAGCHANDIDDQVEVPRSIDGVKVAILFSEGHRGKVRMNFRGERTVSVLALAKQFGGGGHEASAGAILDGSLPEIVARVLPAAEAFVAALPR